MLAVLEDALRCLQTYVRIILTSKGSRARCKAALFSSAFCFPSGTVPNIRTQAIESRRPRQPILKEKAFAGSRRPCFPLSRRVVGGDII
jgi:hypothetical protein